MAVSDTCAYVGNGEWGLQVIGVSNPQNPEIVTYVMLPDSPLGVAISDGHVYAAHRHDGLQVIDIAMPQNPQVVGSVDTPGSANGAAVAGTHAYVADGQAGLQVLPAQCEGTASPAEGDGVAAGLRLAVLPNPSSREVSIRCEALGCCPVQTSVYDLSGRCVRRLLDGLLGGGKHSLAWDGRGDAGVAVLAGIYLVRVATAAGSTTTRSVIIR